MFFDEVRIPVANRVGAENDGWRVAMVTFSFERGTAFVCELLELDASCSELAEVAKKVPAGTARRGTTSSIRREIGRLPADLDALWALTKRNMSQASPDGVPGLGGSVFKLLLRRGAAPDGALAYRILARAGLALGDLGELERRATSSATGVLRLSLSIAAGTSQIQRNIVGRAHARPAEGAVTWTSS